MALYPIKQLQDQNRVPFFPFNTLESVLVNGTDKNLADVLADIYTKEEINTMFATELSQFDIYNSYSDLPETARVGAVAVVATNDASNMYMYYENAWCPLTQKGDKGDKGDTGATGAPGATGSDGFSPIANVSKVGKIATVTITDVLGTTTCEIRDGEDGQGSGDMLKSTYDTDNDGIVDNAEKVNNHTVLSDVPADAVFTDTTYTAGPGITISNDHVISSPSSAVAWGNITGTLADQTDLKNALDAKATSSSLATVATSGSYSDLSNTPTIPTKISDLTNDSDFIEKSNTAGLVKNDGTIDTTSYSTFSGSYNDLSNKPTIPDELADLTDDSTHRVVTDAEKTTWSGKQDALVSGTTIKTINNTSLLGAGDIEVGASIPIQATAPLNPVADDLWIDTSEPEECDMPTDYYSTTETRTNKVWLDNKPIYRKLKTFSLTSTNLSVDSGLTSSVDCITDISGLYTFTNSSNQIEVHRLPYDNVNPAYSQSLAINLGTNNITIKSGTNTTLNGDVVVILEYTKTTS